MHTVSNYTPFYVSVSLLLFLNQSSIERESVCDASCFACEFSPLHLSRQMADNSNTVMQ